MSPNTRKSPSLRERKSPRERNKLSPRERKSPKKEEKKPSPRKGLSPGERKNPREGKNPDREEKRQDFTPVKIKVKRLEKMKGSEKKEREGKRGVVRGKEGQKESKVQMKIKEYLLTVAG